MTNTDINFQMITIKQAAQAYGISERTLRRYIADGKLRAWTIPGARIIRLKTEDIEAAFQPKES